MTEHTPTPWRVFTMTDGRKLVGIGASDGQGILDCGFGVWAWDDAEGIANAWIVVNAVNSYQDTQDLLTDIWFHFSATDDPILRGLADRARTLILALRTTPGKP